MVAFLVVNIGVFAVAGVRSTTAVAAGVGLDLFGVLSIIRLRSTELEQHEVACYFSALALGLLAGLSPTPNRVTLTLMAIIGTGAVTVHGNANDGITGKDGPVVESGTITLMQSTTVCRRSATGRLTCACGPA